MGKLSEIIANVQETLKALPPELELPASLQEFEGRGDREIFVATPTIDGKVEGHYFISMIEALHAVRSRGYRTRSVLKPHCVYLPMVRSKIVYEFMESTATDLFFVDADQGFTAEGFLKVLERDEDIVGGVPPMKHDEPNFPGLLAKDENGFPALNPETGLIEAVVLGTGFLRIKRAAIEQFLDHYGRDELLIIERHANGEESCRYWNVFDTRKEGTTWWGEDVFFGNQWRAMGMKLWVDPDITFTHTGTKTWEGNLWSHLMAQRSGTGPAPSAWKFSPRVDRDAA